jgi:hypothetical protein
VNSVVNRLTLDRMSESELCAVVNGVGAQYGEDDIELAWNELDEREIGALSRAEIRVDEGAPVGWLQARHIVGCLVGLGLGFGAHWVIGVLLK